MSHRELEMVVVHTDEELTVQYNPLTHMVTEIEVEEGNHFVRIHPRSGELPTVEEAV